MLGNPIFLLCLASIQWLAAVWLDKSWARSVCVCVHIFSVWEERVLLDFRIRGGVCTSISNVQHYATS